MNKEAVAPSEGTWDSYMRTGAFEKAWLLSDAVLQQRKGIPCWHLPRHFQYIWDGSPLHGKKVLVRCYHGLGDTIQFIRYMPMLKAVAEKVIVWAQSRLIPLLQTVAGIDELWPLHDGTPDRTYDVDVELMELPHIFRTTLNTIPAQIPYLHVDSLPIKDLSSGFSVGLVWRSGDWDARRSIPFPLLQPLAAIPGVQYYLLQSDAHAAGWDESFGICIGGRDVLEDARIIKSLDLVITVDTMIAHLTGALGVPVWNLLPINADWRWMEEREDSPWYPTMRLFRQPSSGAWEPVIQQVVSELKNIMPPPKTC